MNRDEIIVDLVRDARVVHLGCADWPYTDRRIEEGRLLHDLLLKASRHCIGVDLNDERLDRIREEYPEDEFTTFADLGTISKESVLVAGEVIEHIENPGSFLESLSNRVQAGTQLLITTPNAQSLKQALRGLVGGEVQHPDHVVLFTQNTLVELASRYGWECTSFSYYNSRTRSRSFLRGLCRKPVELLLDWSARASDGMIAMFVKKR
jgi:hypothetical protein